MRSAAFWVIFACSLAPPGACKDAQDVACSCSPHPLECARSRKQISSNVTLVMALTSGPYEAFAQHAVAVNSDFAKHAGFAFRCLHLPAGSPLEVRQRKPRVLQTELANVAAESWLLWMDGDAAVTNFSWPLQDLMLQSQAQSHRRDVLGSKDPTSSARHGAALMNTGILLVKNTRWAQRLIDRWAQVAPGEGQDDQYVLNKMFLSHESLRKKAAVLETTVLNSRMPMYANSPVPPVAHLMYELDSVRTMVLHYIRQLRCQGKAPTQRGILNASEHALQQVVDTFSGRAQSSPISAGGSSVLTTSAWDVDGIFARFLHLHMVKCQLCRQSGAGACSDEAASLQTAIAAAEALPPTSAKLWLTVGNALNALEAPSTASLDAYRRAIALQRNFKSGSGMTAEERLVQILRDVGQSKEAHDACARLAPSGTRALVKWCSNYFNVEL